MIGSTIGTYRVLGTLGQGGMGTVYVAEHVLLGRRVALKVLLPAYSLDQEIVRRFFNEARAVTLISDPGIVQIFDFGIHTNGSAYLVMELLEGEPLDARLRRHGRLPPLDAVRLVRQCAGSLAAAHARGIIHRDLKPENLYAVGDPAVTGGERLKILDFGIAKLVGDEVTTSRTRTGVLIGTPIYMSPEQCRGLGELDFRSDVYSLGCVLFALLAGRPPFVHDSSGELIVAHLKEAPPALTELVPGLPRELDEVVQACLAKAPAARHASMQAFAHALDLVVATALVPAIAGASYPTPVPGATGRAPAATTLGTASGESTAPRARLGRRGVVIAASAVTAVALGIAGVAGVALRGGGSPAAAPPARAAPPTLPKPTESSAAPSDPASPARSSSTASGAPSPSAASGPPSPSAASRPPPPSTASQPPPPSAASVAPPPSAASRPPPPSAASVAPPPSAASRPPLPSAASRPPPPSAASRPPPPSAASGPPPPSPASPTPSAAAATAAAPGDPTKPSRVHRPRPRPNQEEPHVPTPSHGAAMDRGD